MLVQNPADKLLILISDNFIRLRAPLAGQYAQILVRCLGSCTENNFIFLQFRIFL